MDVIKLLGGVEKMRRDLAEHEKEAAGALNPHRPYSNALLFIKECGLCLRLRKRIECYSSPCEGYPEQWWSMKDDDWIKARILFWLRGKTKIGRYGIEPFDPSARELNELLKALRLVLAMTEETRDNVVKLRK